MLTKTTMSALRAVVYLAQQKEEGLQSPRRIGEALGESPTYMAKALRHLVKAGILRAERGALGGVKLGRRPKEITLLALVEACQGTMVGDFCESKRPASTFCGFHEAALELHNAIQRVLSRWTLADLVGKPEGKGPAKGGATCVMAGLRSIQMKDRMLTQIGR